MSTLSAPPMFGTARHPFRASLPLHALKRLPRLEPEVQARIDAGEGLADEEALQRRPWLTLQDAKDFLLAYLACFMAVSAFLG